MTGLMIGMWQQRTLWRQLQRLVLVLAPMTLVACACAAVVALDGRADVHAANAERVAEVRYLAARVSAREWEAVAEQRVTDATVREVDQLLVRMHADLQGAADDDRRARDVLAVLDRYSAAVRDEFTALRRGDFEEAEEIDEGRVDPAFAVLQTRVETIEADEQSDAAEVGDQALLGSLLVIVMSSSALFGVTLVTLHARGRLARSELQRATVRESEERMQALLRNSSDVLLVLGPGGSVRYASQSVDRLLGNRSDEILGRDVGDLLDDADRAALASHLERASAHPGRPVVTEWALKDARGEVRFVEAILNDLSADARVGGVVVNARDITERRRLEAELRRRAYHDELTGLANRALFEDRIRQALARSDRHGGAPAVLFLDLDDFKTVNDSLGHATGDALLRLVAGRVESCVRAEDTVARLGGDEFGILLPDAASAGDALEVADKVLTSLTAPLMVAGHSLSVGASVGVALAPALGGDHGDRLQAILRDADIAMYAAKGSGKHRVELFESALHAPIVGRLRLRGELQTALDEGQLVLHYQPVVDLATSKIVGAEALVRWQHPERGLVPPADFIPIAEQTGLILPLGRWVMHEALRQARVWRERHPANCPAYVAVNVAGRQLEAPGFVGEVADALAGSGVPASMLMIEMTETSLIEDSEMISAKLQALRDLGVRLAIDDFGTGYSALNYLRRFPMDVLKIDRSFINDVAGMSQESALVEAMISMSATLGLKVVAEGVEQHDQCARLQELRCSYGQGYLFSRPLPATSMDTLLAGEAAATV